MSAPLHAHLQLDGKCRDIRCCSTETARPMLRLNRETGTLEVDPDVSRKKKKDTEQYSYQFLWDHFKTETYSERGVDVVRFVRHLDPRSNSEVGAAQQLVAKLEKKPEKFKASDCLFLEGVIKREMRRIAKQQPQTRTIGTQISFRREESSVSDLREEGVDSPLVEELTRRSESKESSTDSDPEVVKERRKTVAVTKGSPEEVPPCLRSHTRKASVVVVPVQVIGAEGELSALSADRLVRYVMNKNPEMPVEEADAIAQDVIEQLYLNTFVVHGSVKKGVIRAQEIGQFVSNALERLK